MPGAVEMESKMEDRNAKRKRKRVAAAVQESDSGVGAVYTLSEAYARYQISALNGRHSAKAEATLRDRSVTSAQFLNVESHSSLVERSHNLVGSSTEKGQWYQESCITEDGSGSDNSDGTGNLEAALSPRRASGNGLAKSLSQDEADKTEVKRKRPEDVENRECSGEELLIKGQKLSEEARVWRYVCKRSVFVSPPQRGKDSRVHLGSRQTELGRDDVFKEKTSTMDVIVNEKVIKVTLTKESSVAQEWIEQQNGKCFGLDLEWQPNRQKGRPENKVALMQISSDTECLLIQMLFLDSIPSALVQFLKDPERKFVGVGIHEDTKKLHRDFALISQGEVELTTLAVAHFKRKKLKGAGLKALAKLVLGFDMDKNKKVTMSNWARSYLDRRQVEYASIDAWISLAIFCGLQKSPVLAA